MAHSIQDPTPYYRDGKAPGFWQTQLQRVLHKIALVSPGGFSIRPVLHRIRGVKIDEGVWVGQYVYIDGMYPEAVSIGKNAIISLRTSILTHLLSGFAGPVVIEEDVFVGPHCVILPNTRIGKGAVIKAGTVVSRNIPPGTFWGPPPPVKVADVEVPLTVEHSYGEFLRGMRPVRRRKPPE
jgi:acetyltransferase-like isoleucine patch superfamily enzyme